MRAIVMNEYGGPEVLVPAEVPEPEPREGWVTVRLQASALNWHDTLMRQGIYGSPLPITPGADGAGVVVETGEEVMILPSLHWGERGSAPSADFEILGDQRNGTYAELVSVPAENVFPRPSGWSALECAAFPLVGVTAYRALFTRGRLASGESLLVLGASGGVATMAVALAVAAGAKVTVTSTSPEKIARACELGASTGIDHSTANWVEEARRSANGGEGFDLVLDPVGRVDESIGTLRAGGRCVVLGANARDTAPLAVRPFYFGQYDLLGTTMGGPRDFAGLLRLVDSESVRPPVIDRVFSLEQAAEAHRYLEGGGGFGKVVLDHG
ncbi:zinc-binding dehydrogenase [Arthrobacter rhombi]|uniref:quinone oxidoreductase family protein n=1 Tax=Arthrobacter rhombi TaxID=71253 RepID=UPI0031D84256